MALNSFIKIGFLLTLNQKLCVTDTQAPVSFYDIPGVKDEVYSEPGDINIGDIVTTSIWHNEKAQRSPILSSLIPEATEPVKFATDLINRDPNLLPGVKFGFHIRASHGSVTLKLATSLAFLPRSERICNDTNCYSKHMKESDSQWLTHDVIGILSPEDPAEAIHIASLYSVARLPILGYNTENNELSRRYAFPYFLRLNSYDYWLSFGLLEFVHQMGWKYISIVYTDDDYGRNAFVFIHRFANDYNVHIAASHLLGDYDKVASDIVKNKKARAIIVFVSPWRFKTLLQKVIDRNSTRHYIWIGSHKLNGYNGYTYNGVTDDPAIGAFLFYPSTKYIPSYYDHIRKLVIGKSNNPWLKPIWEHFLNCSYDEGTCDPNADILNNRRYRTYKSAALKIDAVLTFAHAAHDMIQDRCPDAQGKEARDCIDEELLLKYILKVNFQGLNQRVSFDSYWEDTDAYFTVTQLTNVRKEDPFGWNPYRRIYERPVAVYDVFYYHLDFLNAEISWTHLDPAERIVPWTNDSSLPIEIPESTCSRPCVIGEYKVALDVPICWLCRRCRENERLVKGDTPCEACPFLMWPDPESKYTTCIDIPPTYQTMEDTLPIIFISIAVVFISLAAAIFLAYMIYRNDQGIKSSCRELSEIQLLAIFVGYTTIILFQTTPTDDMCLYIFYLFCMSFAMLYSPLLVKTSGMIQRIKHGLENDSKVTVKSRSQIYITISLNLFQFLLCVATAVLYMPGAKRYQPNRSEKLVEISCDFTIVGLGSFLGYNIMLVLVSAVNTLMARGLEGTFQELKFTSMCVSTTLLIWLTFLPTYFTATRAYIKGAILCMALLLNHTVALVFLFIPKIYTAILSSGKGDISTQ